MNLTADFFPVNSDLPAVDYLASDALYWAEATRDDDPYEDALVIGDLCMEQLAAEHEAMQRHEAGLDWYA